ncbi:RNA polymerase-associated protein RapA [subsurface metagenome]
MDGSVDCLRLNLLFNYEGRIFPFQRQEIFLRLQNDDNDDNDNGEYLAAARNKMYEKSCFLFLTSLMPEKSILRNTEDNQYAPYLLILSNGMDHFLINYGQKLLDKGFELRRKGKRIRSINRLSITISKNMDWLDMNIEMVDEKGEILALDINPDMFEGSFIRNEDTYYLLKERDIARLKELYKQGKVKQGKIQISRYNYTLIDELYEDIKNREDEEILKMRQIIQGLKNFSEIKKVRIPNKFKGVLRDYQKSGLNWLYFLNSFGVNGCLADDMGLGKTVQTLALLLKLKDEHKLKQALIAAPVSTLANWEEESKRFTPSLKVLVYHGSERSKKIKNIDDCDIILTSYHTLRNDVELLTERKLTYLILDEAQTVKNPSSQIHKCVRMLSSEHRLSLTGTPVENNTTELWALMNFLNPGLLGSLASFNRNFSRPIEEKESTYELELLKKTIFPFLLRRKKEDVLDDLPPKEEIIQYVEMGPAQQKIYNEIKEYYRKKVAESVDKGGVGQSAVVIFEALLKLRQAALFPVMAADKYKKIPSCKFDLLQIVLEEILSEGHKVLVFSQFLKSLSFIRKWVKHSGIDFTYLDGSTKDRAAQIKSFQTDVKKRVFLISLKAGGLGINLTAADYVILFDPWWNPAIETQAVDRSHRIGQTNKVITYKIITRNTVEEKILKLQEKKKKLVQEIITTEKGFFKSLARKDIMNLFE